MRFAQRAAGGAGAGAGSWVGARRLRFVSASACGSTSALCGWVRVSAGAGAAGSTSAGTGSRRSAGTLALRASASRVRLAQRAATVNVRTQEATEVRDIFIVASQLLRANACASHNALRAVRAARLRGRDPGGGGGTLALRASASRVRACVRACVRARGQHECGDGILAEGRLRDTLHRVYTFGLSLNRLDIRQESSRHEEARHETCCIIIKLTYYNILLLLLCSFAEPARHPAGVEPPRGGAPRNLLYYY